MSRVELKPREDIKAEDLSRVNLSEEDRRIARFASVRRDHHLPEGHRVKVPT